MTGKTSHRLRMKEASDRSYPPDSLLNQRSVISKKRLCLSLCFSQRALIMGVSVSETTALMITDPATTTPNSRKSRPVKPLRKMMGRNTAANVTVVLMMAKVISFDPSCPAFIGSMPPSILL